MKNEIIRLIDGQGDYLQDMANKIWDNPEVSLQEHFAAELLTGELEKLGFTVERGICGLPTAFRAVWKQGEGGPNIGLLGEYDALPGLGHGCGHHMQTPGAIGAMIALRQVLAGTGRPYTLTLYGTPAEENGGGKELMLREGAFKELDVALGNHASSKSRVGICGHSKACQGFDVTFHGISSHAAGAPEKGRSAVDAMLLSFNGIEFLREHVPEGSRMSYTITQSTGPANVVPGSAWAKYGLRSDTNEGMRELERRFREVIRGACIMTETTAEITAGIPYLARKANLPLAKAARAALQAVGIPLEEELLTSVKESSDLGNVSCAVPTVGLPIPYISQPIHSVAWVEAGKGADARKCILNTAKAIALLAYDLICDPELVKQAKDAFDAQEV